MALVIGTAGNDTIRPGTSSAGVVGVVGNGGDSILGGDGNDNLQGGTGNDTINGGGGNDGYFGSLGNDVFTDPSGTDFLNYVSVGGNITISYAGSFGTVGKSVGGTDSVSGNFTSITTGAGDDTITAGTATDTGHFHFYDAGFGANLINGGSNSNNVVSFGFATAALTINLQTGSATGTGITDTLNGVRSVLLSNFNDTVIGSATGVNDFVLVGAGSHRITGGGGGDNRADYYREASGITADLSAGTVVHAGGTDTVSNIQRIAGTYSADSITGTTGNDVFYPLGGADTVIGNGGVDRLVFDGYAGSAGFGAFGVNINLTTSTGTNTFGDALHFSGIRNVEGSIHNDTLVGTDVLSSAAGLPGYPSLGTTFLGSLGSDSIDGVMTFASISAVYTTYTGPLTASFTDWNHGTVNKGSNGTDTLAHVNQFTGTNGADSIAGTQVSAPGGTYSYTLNLAGAAGNDTINGFGLSQNRADYAGATGAAVIDLGAGTAQDGQGGTDSLIGIVRVRGSNFNDSITGSSLNDIIEVQAGGNHTLDGAGGFNTVRYSGLEDVTIDLGSVAAASGGGYVGSLHKSGGAVDSITRFTGGTGGDGNDTITGTPDGDTITGGAGNNLLDGRGGSNTLSYSTNFYSGPPTHGATVDLVHGTATNPWGGTDTLSNFTSVLGTPLNDSILGAEPASGTAYLRGGNGADTLAASHTGQHIAADYLGDIAGVTVHLATGTATDGWGNTDSLINISAVRGSAFADSLVGGAGSETLEGGGGNDTLVGAQRGDLLEGGEGDDSLVGGSGADTMVGGSGNDSYAVGIASDQIVEAAGGGIDTVYARVSYTLAAYVENLTLTVGARTGTGNGLDNVLTGTVHNDTLIGLDGNDTLVGNAGNDSLSGGAGNDSLIAGDGNDGLSGGDGNDTLVGGGGNDKLQGGGGSDVFRFTGIEGNTKVLDFMTGLDRLEVAFSTFVGAGLVAGAQLDNSHFAANAHGHATAATAQFVYDTSTGKLWWDADGSGAGAHVLVATLTGNPALHATDIWGV